MKKWVLKAVVQKIISFFPGSHRVNFLFQKYVTRGVYLTDGYFSDRLEHAKDHLQAFRAYGQCDFESTLELGTGWYPVVPVCMFLAGAEKIYTVDISPLCNKKRMITTLEKFMALEEKVKAFIPVKEERWKKLSEVYRQCRKSSFEQMLQGLNMIYLLRDARKLDLPSSSVSLVHSNNTFEHIYAVVLREILAEFSRITVRGGVMSHFIDMSDHFAHSDRSITIYNYLRFSAKQWKLIDNSIQPQNRMRISDYRRLYASLKIPVTKEAARQGDLSALRSVKIHTDFLQIPAEELAASHCLLISLVK